MANEGRAGPLSKVKRDLRLDLYRGMGLWMIFLDHIPDRRSRRRKPCYDQCADALLFRTGAGA